MRTSMATHNFTMGHIVPEHKRLDVQNRGTPTPQSYQRVGMTVLAQSKNINFADVGVKNEFKTINQQTFRWI